MDETTQKRKRLSNVLIELSGAFDALEKPKSIQRKWQIGRLEIAFTWNSSVHFWGRFGGGWNWALGFQASRRSILLSLLICYVVFTLKRQVEDK